MLKNYLDDGIHVIFDYITSAYFVDVFLHALSGTTLLPQPMVTFCLLDL